MAEISLWCQNEKAKDSQPRDNTSQKMKPHQFGACGTSCAMDFSLGTFFYHREFHLIYKSHG